MKTTNIFNKVFFASALLASTLFISSCDNDDDDDDLDTMYTVSGDASGSQETPPVSTSATGTFSGTYNSSNNKLDYTINWTGLTGAVSVAHFHGPALPGVSADPVIDISIGGAGASGTLTASATLTESQESDLLNGRIYYNIHTVLHPAGEVRGQLTATTN